MLFALIIGAVYFAVIKSIKEYRINKFDIYIAILFVLALYNLSYISNATIFNVNTWYFIGYLFLYLILRQILHEKETIYKALNCVYLFIVFGAVLNGVMAVLQNSDLLVSEN